MFLKAVEAVYIAGAKAAAESSLEGKNIIKVSISSLLLPRYAHLSMTRRHAAFTARGGFRHRDEREPIGTAVLDKTLENGE